MSYDYDDGDIADGYTIAALDDLETDDIDDLDDGTRIAVSEGDAPTCDAEAHELALMIGDRLAAKAAGMADPVDRLELVDDIRGSLRNVDGIDLSALIADVDLAAQLDRIRDEAIAELT